MGCGLEFRGRVRKLSDSDVLGEWSDTLARYVPLIGIHFLRSITIICYVVTYNRNREGIYYDGYRKAFPYWPSPWPLGLEMCLGQVQGPVEISSATTGVLAHPRPSSSMWYYRTDWTVTHPSGVKQGGTGWYHPVGGVGHLVIRNKLTMRLSDLPNLFHGWIIHPQTNMSSNT